MKRPAFLTLFLLTGAVTALAAQEQQNDKKLQQKQQPDSKAADLLANVAKNMKAAEERLKQQDPGDTTRKIQRDIVDDLEELIKQNEKSKSGAKSSKKMQSGAKNSGEKSSQKQQGADKQEGAQEKDGQKPEEKDGHGKAKGAEDDAVDDDRFRVEFVGGTQQLEQIRM